MKETPLRYAYRCDYLRAWVDEPLKLMYSEWLRPVSSKEYRTGLLDLAVIIKKRYVVYWITETSVLGDIAVSDQKWALETLLPMLSGSDIRKVARVNASDIGSYFSTQSISDAFLESTHTLPEFRQFWSYKEAADWIASIKV